MKRVRFGRRALAAFSLLTIAGASLVDRNIDKHGTRAVAEEYLKFLWSPEGQEIGARNHYRPRDETVLARHSEEFPKIELFTIDEVFGGWDKAQKTHFEDKGVFDQIYTPK